MGNAWENMDSDHKKENDHKIHKESTVVSINRGLILATTPSPMGTRLHRCSSPLYKMAEHSHLAFTHLPKYFKSSLDNIYHKIQWNCQINSCWCAVNSSFCFFIIFWICFSKVFNWWLVKSANVELVDTDVIICMLMCVQCVKW